MTKLEANLLQGLFDSDTPIRRAVFCTYTFDPTYFTDVIYPELRNRGCERVLILMDARQYQSVTGDLGGGGRVVVERFPGGLFHPKVFLLAGTGFDGKGLRCVIGSANLTNDGFEKNRELFSCLTERTCDIDRLIEWFNLVAGKLRAGSSAECILHETVAELRAAKVGQEDEKPATIVWNGLGPLSLWHKLQTATDGQKLNKAVIVSPYFESLDNFDHGMLDEWLAGGLKVELFVPFDQANSRVPRDEIGILAQRYPGRLNLYGLVTNGRVLHGKLIALMSRSRAWILTGSVNFTAAALRGSNIETGLLFEMRRDEADKYLDQLLLADAKPVEPQDLPDPTLPQPMLHNPLAGLITSAILSPSRDCLTLIFERPLGEIGIEPSNLIIEIAGQVLGLMDFEPPVPLNDTQLVITPASRYLRDPETDSWQLGIVVLRTRDNLARDWRFIESEELLDETGVEFVVPLDLETFVAGLLNPRLVLRRTPSNGGPGNGGRPTPQMSLGFEDVEGKLDLAYRFAVSLGTHFGRLVTDPYTVHRWRGDWLRMADLIQRDRALPALGCKLIAARQLVLLDQLFAQYVGDIRQWTTGDNEFRASLQVLYSLAVDSTDFSAPTIATLIGVGQ